MLKGRIPSDKDLKKEIAQALRLEFSLTVYVKLVVLSSRNFTFSVSVLSLFYFQLNHKKCAGISLSLDPVYPVVCMHCFPDYTIPFLSYFKFNKTDWSSRCLFIHCLMLQVFVESREEGES